MKTNKTRKSPSGELREQAEALLRQRSQDLESIPSDDIERLFHELQVHQIKLEMQNEQLHMAQADLNDSWTRYYDLYDFAPFGYFTCDQDGLILEANLTGADLLQVERRDLIKQGFSRFIAPDFQDVFYFHRKLVLETETKQTCKLKFVKKDGSLLCAQLESVAVQDGEGSFTQLRTAVIDVTESKWAEEELRRQGQIVSATRDHMSFIDRHYIYQTVNDEYLRAYTKKREEIVGYSVAEVLGQDVFEELVKDKLDRCLAGEEIHYQAWSGFPDLGRRYMDVAYYPFILKSIDPALSTALRE